MNCVIIKKIRTLSITYSEEIYSVPQVSNNTCVSVGKSNTCSGSWFLAFKGKTNLYNTFSFISLLLCFQF